MCGVPPPYWHPVHKICAVSPPPGINFFCAVSLQFSSVPWTLWLCLGFWARLRILQVPACKMKPNSTSILEFGTPGRACFLAFSYYLLIFRRVFFWILLLFTWYVPDICLRYTWELREICHPCAWDTYTRNRPEILYVWYVRDTPRKMTYGKWTSCFLWMEKNQCFRSPVGEGDWEVVQALSKGKHLELNTIRTARFNKFSIMY